MAKLRCAGVGAALTGVDPGGVARVLREASFRGRLDMPALHAIAEDGNRPGVVVLRRSIDLRLMNSDGYGSDLEASVDRYVRRRAIVPGVPNLVIDVEGDRLRVDDVRREDERRTRLLEARGWLVIRIHWTEWEADRAAATARVLEAVAERAASARR
jgi:hypothetical protein